MENLPKTVDLANFLCTAFNTFIAWVYIFGFHTGWRWPHILNTNKATLMDIWLILNVGHLALLTVHLVMSG